ncbi:shikimate dehydrogenase [Bacillaceae bacterium]
MNSETKLVGLFGYPVGHSISPAMQNAAFRALGINMRYAAFAVEPSRLQNAVEGIRALRFRGVNVTIPHKVAIIPFLDELDEEAREIGAVNTVVNADGKLIGYNTDGKGYVTSLVRETGISLPEQAALVLGAGGAARAVAVSLARSGIGRLVIANRTERKAQELAERVAEYTETAAIALEKIPRYMPDVTLVINTTSVGMHPQVDAMPLEERYLRPGLVVSDLVYNPLETRLLRRAREAGAQVHNGLGMFVHQGALAFRLWTGTEAPVDLMRETALRQLKGETSEEGDEKESKGEWPKG